MSESIKTDKELMEEIANGDRRAVGKLYLRYGNSVLRYLTRVLNSRETAEDLCQELFLTVINIAGGYEEQGKLKSWLLGIASNKARSHRKKMWLREKLMRINSLLFEKYDSPAPYNEMEDRLSSAFQKLPYEQREILSLQIGEGLSGEEISEALCISHSAVRVRLHRARHNFRIALDNETPKEVGDEKV